MLSYCCWVCHLHHLLLLLGLRRHDLPPTTLRVLLLGVFFLDDEPLAERP